MNTQPNTTLLHTFHGHTWSKGPIYLYAGTHLPKHLPVSAAFCFLLDNNNHIVLVNIRKRGWDIPGGGTEKGETPQMTLTREIWEETGLTDKHYQKPQSVGHFILPNRHTPGDSVMAVYKTLILPDINPKLLIPVMNEEVSEAKLFALEDLPEQTSARVWQPLLKHITANKP